MLNCTFCKIASGKADALVVYESEHVIAFFPKSMEVLGHTLVVPKQHYVSLYDIPSDLLGELMNTCKIISLAYRERIGAVGMNILHASGTAAQQSSHHFHIHLLPRFTDDGLNTWPNLPPVDVDKENLLKKLRMF